MTTEPDVTRVYDDLVRFETALWDAVDQRLRDETGLPLGRFETMHIVDRIDGCRASDIARALSITEGGTSKIIVRLEAEGYLFRSSHPGDARSSIVALTAEGERMLRSAQAVFRAELESRLAGTLAPDDLTAFASTLAKLRASIHQPGVPVASTSPASARTHSTMPVSAPTGAPTSAPTTVTNGAQR